MRKKLFFKKVEKQPIFFVAVCLALLYGLFLFLNITRAADFISTNFILRDPVISASAGRSTTLTYEFFSNVGQLNSSISTSTNFSIFGGFLYFPNITTPTLTATAGNAQASLAWTEATSTFGYSVTSYEVGQSTVSGGPYTYTNVGNVLSSTRSSLSNGTAYYFLIRVKDNQGDVIATSSQATATSVAPTVTPPSGGGGGGGGGGGYVPPPVVVTKVIFSGRAYPKSTVTILKDAQIATTAIANIDGTFNTEISSLSAGNYVFSVYAEDKDGRRSSLVTFPVSVTAGTTVTISNIFVAPTIDVDKIEVKRGEDIVIFGQTAPQSDVTITVNSDETFFAKTIADSNGVYLQNFDTTVLEYGSHSTKSKSSIGNQLVSGFSMLASFKVGTVTVEKKTGTKVCGKADLNCDGRVNLVDFSIAAFWYKRPLSTEFIIKESQSLNGDGKIDLIDFSIMAFYWTG